MMKQQTEPVLGLGERVSDHFTGEAWLRMLSAEKSYDCMVYNVTFAPATRNDWHRHSLGQILLCTEGCGLYQQQGHRPRVLHPGDVVHIPAEVIHWHGATPDSCFTHVGITPRSGENRVEWLGAVTDDLYNQAVADK